MPQVEHDGASPRNAEDDGVRPSGEAVFGLASADVPATWLAPSSSLKEVLGLRYSDEMNLPPSQRAM
jgi:hypothetical protein